MKVLIFRETGATWLKPRSREAGVQGADPRKIARALDDLAKGDADAARSDFETAIEDYRKVRNEVKNCNNQ